MEKIALTPFAVSEYKLAQETRGSCRSFLSAVYWESREFGSPYAADEIQAMVEAARLFYVRSYLGMEGPTSGGWTGFRRQKVFSRGKDGNKVMTPAAISFMGTAHLWSLAERLRGVTIDFLDAFKCMERYDSEKTLFYVDPPYPRWARARDGEGYKYELSEEDYVWLTTQLQEMKGMVVLSGYEFELYQESFAGWERFARQSRVDGDGSAVEVLWLNKAASEARK